MTAKIRWNTACNCLLVISLSIWFINLKLITNSWQTKGFHSFLFSSKSFYDACLKFVFQIYLFGIFEILCRLLPNWKNVCKTYIVCIYRDKKDISKHFINNVYLLFKFAFIIFFSGYLAYMTQFFYNNNGTNKSIYHLFWFYVWVETSLFF